MRFSSPSSDAAGENPFSVLGVEPRISDADLRARYTQLVRENPPERNPAAFQRIRRAYEALRRPQDRAAMAIMQMVPPAATNPNLEGKAIGPLGISPTWWLMADPWSELTRRDFSADCRNVVKDVYQEPLPLHESGRKDEGL